MATINLQLVNICSGGNHLTFNINLDGGPNRSATLLLDEVLDNVTDEELEKAIIVLAKAYRKGKTANATKTGLQAGLAISV